MKLKDITFNPPNHPFVVDVIKNLTTKEGSTLVCIKCKKEYQRDTWDFYSLCNECFAEFDKQKMRGRFSFRKIPYFESAQEWVKSLKI